MPTSSSRLLAIHDPVHGTIEVTWPEIKLIDARPCQRLRFIKQLGFADLAFPGATHSRYAHSLGAMHMATRIFDKLAKTLDLAPSDHTRLRQAVRLAILCHDLGHPPMSHVSERVMPQVQALGIDAWLEDSQARRAHHEDYSILLLVNSELTPLVTQYFGHIGVTAEMLAALVCGRLGPLPKETFVVRGVDLLPLLSQIVSSELDADRMDYLRRDAYYCGVSYGNFDHVWLCNNLAAVEHDDKLVLGLQHKAVWAFENFLLARYHMFLAVYYHHTPVCFDHLLGRFYDAGAYTLPADASAYLDCDDVQLWMTLRSSDNPWAKHLVRRRPYKLLVETHQWRQSDDGQNLRERLQAQGIDFFWVQSEALLSKYFKKRATIAPLLVLEPEMKRARRIEDYTPLYQRFEDVVGLSRLYCKPEHFDRARACLDATVQ